MNKSELIVKIKNATSFDSMTIKQSVDVFFEAISAAMINGESVLIKGFGTFSLRKKNARMGYDPQTGRKFYITERQLPFFKAGSALKAAMNAHKFK